MFHFLTIDSASYFEQVQKLNQKESHNHSVYISSRMFVDGPYGQCCFVNLYSWSGSIIRLPFLTVLIWYYAYTVYPLAAYVCFADRASNVYCLMYVIVTWKEMYALLLFTINY